MTKLEEIARVGMLLGLVGAGVGAITDNKYLRVGAAATGLAFATVLAVKLYWPKSYK